MFTPPAILAEKGKNIDEYRLAMASSPVFFSIHLAISFLIESNDIHEYDAALTA